MLPSDGATPRDREAVSTRVRAALVFGIATMAGGGFGAVRSEADTVGPVGWVAIAILAAAAGIGLERVNSALALGIVRRSGPGSFDSAPGIARWWWVSSLIVGALIVEALLTRDVGWTLPIAAAVTWSGGGAVGTAVLLWRDRRSRTVLDDTL